MLYVGEGLRGSNGARSTLCQVQSLPPLPTIKLGPCGVDSRMGELVHALGPCGSLQQTLLWGWEFLLLPQPHRCLQSEVWGFISPRWNSGLRGLSPGPPSAALPAICSFAHPTPLHNPPPCWVQQLLPYHESSPPGCLDECFFFIFLIVGLPYSSIFCQFWLFFVFKICCCPSFGCVRRHSVSTYTSILARSLPSSFSSWKVCRVHYRTLCLHSNIVVISGSPRNVMDKYREGNPNEGWRYEFKFCLYSLLFVRFCENYQNFLNLSLLIWKVKIFLCALGLSQGLNELIHKKSVVNYASTRRRAFLKHGWLEGGLRIQNQTSGNANDQNVLEEEVIK